MTITEIKSALGVESLNLNMGVNPETKEETGWYRMWDNDSRTSVVLHKDTLAKIQSGHSNLGIKAEQKTGAKGAYTLKTIVAYTEADVVL